MMIATTLLALALQTPTLTATLKPNVPFKIAFEGSTDDSFRWWCDGQIISNFKTVDLVKGPADANGFQTVTANVPGLPVGKHVCFVSSTNDFMDASGLADARSETIPVIAGNVAKTPLGLRIVFEIVIK